ncbi:MAG: oxygen-independent coproporphyrinogen III oxidase [Pseudomonadota bacterium]
MNLQTRIPVHDAGPAVAAVPLDLLARRHDGQVPRYTSYPTADRFHEEFTADDQVRNALASNAAHRPLSLYIHLPFCATVCYYCACNRIVTANRARVRPYLDLLKEEIRMQAALFDSSRPVRQLHWGGGTPTFLSGAEMTELMHHTARHFHLLEGDRGEYSIEIDPRTVDAGTLALLRGLGFNRLSLGVQDFDPRVQKAVNRIQDEAQVRSLVEAARSLGFRSLGFDLIYGLPLQSVASFRRTLAQVIALKPDRLSVFNYAHLPARFHVQRQIDEAELPPPAEKLRILDSTVQQLLAAGYVHIGMDHFALPGDELAQALHDGTLRRNFQGYSTGAGTDLVGIGLSAISDVNGVYAQNHRDMADYEFAVREHQLPVARGFAPDSEDRLRRHVIMELACRGRLDYDDIGHRYGIDFRRHFAAELQRLDEFAGDGLLVTGDHGVQVTDAGRFLLRSLCAVFDRWLDRRHAGFSRAI